MDIESLIKEYTTIMAENRDAVTAYYEAKQKLEVLKELVSREEQ